MDRLLQATLSQSDVSEYTAGVSIQVPPLQGTTRAMNLGLIDELDAELEPPPPQNELEDIENDTTMPTWSIPDEIFEYGTQNEECDDDDDWPIASPWLPGAECATGPWTPCPDPELDLDTEAGYSSGSEADIETDNELYAELDDLLSMSPATSRAISPAPGNLVVGGISTFETQAPVDPSVDIAMSDDAQPITEPPKNNVRLPDALRAFQELILKLPSDGDLTVQASESLLKTFNMCLERDLLRCGPDANPGELYASHLRYIQV
ncbi:hypothetical protein RhiJN_23861 [Ceratobasidium sp. AG-Ba]|nr:hypothetical protein RhiJN_23861 [Ceratobasidium sp. AG-Ba]